MKCEIRFELIFHEKLYRMKEYCIHKIARAKDTADG